MAEEVLTIGLESKIPTVAEATGTDVVGKLYSSNFDAEYFLDLLATAGTHLGKLGIVFKDFPAELKDYFDDESVRERAVNILFSAGSITALYLLARKVQQVYQNKQNKAKEIEDCLQMEDDIKEHQKEVEYQRSQRPRTGKDRRELCILCASNRRECVS